MKIYTGFRALGLLRIRPIIIAFVFKEKTVKLKRKFKFGKLKL